MNKLTKIGASALAGSLVASAAHAGSVSVGATWEVTMEQVNGSGNATYKALSNTGTHSEVKVTYLSVVLVILTLVLHHGLCSLMTHKVVFHLTA